MRAFLAAVVISVAMWGCGSAKPGDTCERGADAPDSCGAKLTCVETTVRSDDGTCTHKGTFACEQLCSTDADCSNQSSFFGDGQPTCEKDCAGNSFCLVGGTF